MKKQVLSVLLFIVLLALPVSVFAHSGRTDANGCHTNKKTGEYHCHNAPVSSENKEAKTEARTNARTESRQEAPNTNPIITPISVSEEKFVVVRVVDGDTIELSNGRKVRYIGIDTPETVDPRKGVQCFGKDAGQANKDLVLNKTVILKRDISDTDRYGRLLRYVYLEDGTFVNLWLVKNGYATAYTYPPDVYYSKDFVSAEKEARENQLGLWSPNTCNGNTTTATNATTSTQTTNSTAKYYTSSYYSSKYYYPEDCSGWKSLSSSYLRAFDSLESLLAAYPSRVLSPQCAQ